MGLVAAIGSGDTVHLMFFYEIWAGVQGHGPWWSSESEAERLFYIYVKNFDIETWKRPPRGDLEEATDAPPHLQRRFPTVCFLELQFERLATHMAI